MKKIFAVLACAFATTSTWAYDTPTMGWSSWNAYGFQISESIIKSQADALVTTGLKDAGYIYVNIDDGFFGGRDSEGHLLIHPTRFPNGMRTVVDYITDRRIERAAYLLRHTDVPAAQIAMQSGFGSRQQFYRSFLKQKGLSPQDYRLKHRT